MKLLFIELFDYVSIFSEFFQVKIYVCSKFTFATIATKSPLISCPSTSNKAFKRVSLFCSLSRPDLQNEDPNDFVSLDIEQSIYAKVFVL